MGNEINAGNILGEENTEPAKKLEWLLSTLMQQLEAAVLRNRACELVLQNANLLEAADQVRASSRFDSVQTECKELRSRVLEAVRRNDPPAIFGSLGELLGTLRLTDREQSK
jgi:hypothetical protein